MVVAPILLLVAMVVAPILLVVAMVVATLFQNVLFLLSHDLMLLFTTVTPARGHDLAESATIRIARGIPSDQGRF